jgi:quercetin dioxygenase-like cupin family protein
MAGEVPKMRIAYVVAATCVMAVCGGAITASMKAARAGGAPTPLLLEKKEGERRVWRGWPEHPAPGPAFTIKVDPKNGGSSHLVFLTEDLAPGEKIDAHQHPGSDEILFFETGTARVHLGDSERELHAGSTVFIPAGTLISVSNTGGDVIHAIGIFSSPGFEQFMRDESVREGEKSIPLTKAEDDEIQRKHAHDVIYE